MMSSATYQRQLSGFGRTSGVGVFVFKLFFVWLFGCLVWVGLFLFCFVLCCFYDLSLSSSLTYSLNTNSLPHHFSPPLTAAVIYSVISFFTVFCVDLLQFAITDTGIPTVLYLSATVGLESIENLARESKNCKAGI